MTEITASQPLSLAEQMLYSVARITAFRNGVPLSFGTAFYWSVPAVNDQHMLLLITNKHVIEGADEIRLMAHLSPSMEEPGPSGDFANCNIKLEAPGLFPHPDPNIDLVAINFSDMIRQSVAHGRPIYAIGLNSDFIPSNEQWTFFDAFEEVMMIGCPRGIFDQHNISPISRRGISATPLSNLYEGREEFLVDMACFPGSSGSPVFMVNQSGFLDRKTNTYRMGEGRFFFLGILYAGPTITHEGLIVLHQQPTAQIATMMHLGQCVRSSKVLDIEALALAALKAS